MYERYKSAAERGKINVGGMEGLRRLVYVQVRIIVSDEQDVSGKSSYNFGYIYCELTVQHLLWFFLLFRLEVGNKALQCLE